MIRLICLVLVRCRSITEGMRGKRWLVLYPLYPLQAEHSLDFLRWKLVHRKELVLTRFELLSF